MFRSWSVICGLRSLVADALVSLSDVAACGRRRVSCKCSLGWDKCPGVFLVAGYFFVIVLVRRCSCYRMWCAWHVVNFVFDVWLFRGGCYCDWACVFVRAYCVVGTEVGGAVWLAFVEFVSC